MANTLLTINMITQAAVSLFVNSNAFIQNMNRQYDSSFGVNGAKIGASIRVRLPVDYTVASGAALATQDTVESNLTLTLTNQAQVALQFTSVEETLSVDDYASRYLMPAMNNLAGSIAGTVMAGSEGGVCNIVANVDGSNNILTPGINEVLQARAALTTNSTHLGNRKLVLDPYTMARLAASTAGLMNPASAIGKQYQSGVVSNVAGFDWMEDATVIKHTCGTMVSCTVNGANQTGSSLTVNAITGTLKAGDIISIAGVLGVNRVTKFTTGQVRQFVVTADVANAATSIPIYPAITPGAVAYQTVDVSPSNGAVVTPFANPSAVFRKNIAFHQDAVTLGTADLAIPPAAVKASRKTYDGISTRILQTYLAATDVTATRMDVLYGYLYIRPEWACIVADVV